VFVTRIRQALTGLLAVLRFRTNVANSVLTVSRRDHMRVCRRIKFGNKTLLAFRGVPQTRVSRDARAHVTKECR
jgi:hypothetical protein